MVSDAKDRRPGLSVLVMTYNEEANLPRCLDSVQGLGDEIYILDSFSTDRTVEIARLHGARVAQHVFDSYPAQRQRMIDGAAHDWVLLLDADEYLSPELRASVIRALATKESDGYWVNRLSRIGDHWIRHGSWYPDRKMRLFDRRRIHIIGEDPHDIITTVPGARDARLTGDLLHYAETDMSSRFRTIDKHSTRAAQAFAARGIRPSWWRMCAKPLGRFIKSFVIRRGFLDGMYGWLAATSDAYYVWMREVKLYELKGKREK